MSGAVLIGLGVIFLVDRYTPYSVFAMKAWWAFLVMGMGIMRLVTARDARGIGNGVMFTMFGVWFWIAQNAWLGLDWAHSWPLALIAVGDGIIARSIARAFLPDRWQEAHDA